MKRIYIMSSERSGSNLLRKIIGNSKEVVAPPAIHHTTNLAPLACHYSASEGDYRVERLVSDMILLARTHILPWKEMIDESDVLNRVEVRNFWGAYIALYDALAAQCNREAWVSKDNSLFQYAPEIISFFPDSKFIYLVRDGRDVALSFLNAPSGPGTITDAAKLWLREQQQCCRLLHEYPANIIMVRYEDMVHNVHDVITKVCSFSGIAYSEEMLSFYENGGKEAKASKFWSNLNKPVLSNNANKWASKMSKTRQAYFQSFANGEMKAMIQYLGYELSKSKISSSKSKVLRLLDEIKKYYGYIMNQLYFPERKLRAPKAKALANIKKQLSS